MQVMRGAKRPGHALLRAVRARLGDPGDGRPAAAGLPRPHLLGRRLPPCRSRPGGPACSATSTSAPRRASAASSAEEHRALAEDFCDFMAGDTGRFVRRLEKRDARGGGATLEFELAARLRDDIGALQRATEKNAVVLADGTDADVFAMAGDELEAAVQVFHVRGGRIRGQRGWVVEKVEDLTDAELVEHLLQQVYGDGVAGPSARLGGRAAPERAARTERRASRGARARCCPPTSSRSPTGSAALRGSAGAGARAAARRQAEARGDGAAQRRAGARAAPDPARRRPHHPQPGAAEIQEALGLDAAPLRIECYDISTTQGTYQVGSMVVFEDGLPRKTEYRHFVGPWRGGQRRPRRHGGDARGADAAVPPLPRGPDRTRRRAGRRARWPRRRHGGRPAAATLRLPAAAWWSSTAGRRRSPPPPARWPSSASTTSRCAGSPSASRRCGCRARSTR